jgi:threonine dehydrogenase-like Zn-dependent dehydrogenase
MNRWLDVPLHDYEGHMGSPLVDQLAPLARLFADALVRLRPASVAVLGVAGGNGLEHIDPAVTSRVVGIDVNPSYLEAVRSRLPELRGLELHCFDLGRDPAPAIEPVSLVHAALVFEHAGTAACLDTAVALVAPEGHLSVVLQMPADDRDAVTPTGYASVASLAADFAFVDPHRLRRTLAQRGLRLTHQARITLATGKALWSGCFERA